MMIAAQTEQQSYTVLQSYYNKRLKRIDNKGDERKGGYDLSVHTFVRYRGKIRDHSISHGSTYEIIKASIKADGLTQELITTTNKAFTKSLYSGSTIIMKKSTAKGVSYYALVDETELHPANATGIRTMYLLPSETLIF